VFQRVDLAVLRAVRGQDDDGYLAPGPDALADLKPVEVGQPEPARGGLLTAIAIDGKWLHGVADGHGKLFAALLHEKKVIIAMKLADWSVKRHSFAAAGGRE
jgi:hypothetical protein